MDAERCVATANDPTPTAVVPLTDVSTSDPPDPPPPAILISTVLPDVANVFPVPIKFRVVNPYPMTPPAVLIHTPAPGPVTIPANIV